MGKLESLENVTKSNKEYLRDYIDDMVESETEENITKIAVKNLLNYLHQEDSVTYESLWKLKRKDLKNWRDNVLKKNYSNNTVRSYLGAIKRFCEWLEDEIPPSHLVEEAVEAHNATKEMKRIMKLRPGVSGASKEKIALEIGDLKTLLKMSSETEFKILLLGSYFGLRRNEMRLLRYDDIDYEANTIHIREEITKTDSGERTIHFHERIKKYLKGEGKYVLSNSKGECYSKSTISHRFDKYNKECSGYRKKIEVDKEHNITPHTLRYTFNTHQKRALKDVWDYERARYIVKGLMGHKRSGKKEDLTDYYTGKTRQLLEDERSAMDKYHYFIKNNIMETI